MKEFNFSGAGQGVPDAAFHHGEMAAQERAGMREKMAGIGPKVIRNFMPEQHREFFAQLPFIVVGTQDAVGLPQASILVGNPGFVTSPDERRLQIHAAPLPGDPAAVNFHAGAPVGLLGIEPHTRRRNRANGVIGATDGQAMEIDILQSFGNCPKYIQARVAAPARPADYPAPVIEAGLLNAAMRALIAKADTFFIATAVNSETQGRHGADVSHRGGKPGFVRLGKDAQGADTLTVPDFIGNSFFNTIGNLLVHPHAGLLFPDFERGDLLYLAVHAEIIWEGEEVAAYAGAQRLLRLTLRHARLTPAALPLRWGPAEQSPFLNATGGWH